MMGCAPVVVVVIIKAAAPLRREVYDVRYRRRHSGRSLRDKSLALPIRLALPILPACWPDPPLGGLVDV
jgi:hypothetical protein